ncbi:MAG: hypothetical protein F2640_03455 [Actinobacteria bacterium]|uniref:Unannotated protein n=1 Tax=freshwater metagenome TaxID=449393 RepID=A0A6J6LQI2_9ZZZZ|nr:hypothetical protein [Actinomycetota bacterium]
MRKNAGFNISKLGVEVSEYYPDFYGSMTDLVNAGDVSDRIMVKWHVSADVPPSSRATSDLPHGAISIAIPEDIVALRARSAEEAMVERLRVRAEFLSAFENGYKVVGFSNVDGYILTKESK